MTDNFPGFLVAMPSIDNNPFHQSVVLIAQDDELGSFGVIVNKQLEMNYSEFFSQLDLPTPVKLANKPLHYGGPVDEGKGMVLHPFDDSWESSIHIGDDLSLTSSLDIFESITQDKGPEHFLVLLGHAAWTPGQLDEEIMLNFWLHSPLSTDLIFDDDVLSRWSKTFTMQGIDPTHLSYMAGHA